MHQKYFVKKEVKIEGVFYSVDEWTFPPECETSFLGKYWIYFVYFGVILFILRINIDFLFKN